MDQYEERIKRRVSELNSELEARGCPWRVYYDGFTKDMLSELKGQPNAFILFYADRETDCGGGLRFSTLGDIDAAITLAFIAAERKGAE